MISGTTLACILTVVVGCAVFLYLTGQGRELGEKDHHIRRWTETREAQQNASASDVTPSYTGERITPTPLLAPPEEQPEPDELS